MQDNDITQRLSEMADKWQNADREVFRVCRDAVEEIRVLQTRIEGMNREIAIYQSWSSSRFWPNTSVNQNVKSEPTHTNLGWGKGKDE